MENNPILVPNLITLDFENSLIVALQQEFPHARLRGCYFHFCQAVFRHVQSVGLNVQYNSKDNVRMNIRMRMALAFVPEPIVQQTFDNLKDEAHLIIRPICQYFAQQWLQNIDKQMWNMYGINNDLEGWHNRFNKLVIKHHPNIYKSIQFTIKEQGFAETLIAQGCAETLIAQINAGQVANKKTKTCIEISNRVSKLQKRFDNGEIDVMAFIQGISYNLSNPVAF